MCLTESRVDDKGERGSKRYRELLQRFREVLFRLVFGFGLYNIY